MTDPVAARPAPFEVISAYAPHHGTLTSLLDTRVAAGADEACLVFEDRVWTRAAFREEVDRLARGLVAHGVTPGDRIAVMSTNRDGYVLLFFALARLGAVMVTVNPDFGAEEAGYVLSHARVRAVACTSGTLPVVREACRERGISPWLMSLGEDLDEVVSMSALARAGEGAVLPGDPDPDSTCLIMYTSGTTGFPKGVMHAQRSFVLAGEGFVERMHLSPRDRVLCILPLFHINALFYSLGGALAAGAPLVLAPRFSASGFWKLVSETGATEVNIIAAIGNILARRPRSEFVADHALEKVYGAPVSQAIADVFKHEFGVGHVIEGYGMTEIPGACNLPFDGPHPYGSMGRAAVHPDPGVKFAELRVVDEDGCDVADDEPGELLVRTPIVMRGYYRDPEQTAAAFDGDWFRTGDVVRRASDGFYTFVARRKDIIRRRGENVSGAELDRVVGELEGVAEAASIGVPSSLGEEDILIAVVAAPNGDVDERAVLAWCQARLAGIKVPRYVVMVDELPHTPTHRVAKFRLREQNLVERAVDFEAGT